MKYIYIYISHKGILLIFGIQKIIQNKTKNNTNKCLCKTETDSQIEKNKPVVPKVKRGKLGVWE